MIFFPYLIPFYQHEGLFLFIAPLFGSMMSLRKYLTFGEVKLVYDRKINECSNKSSAA
jgi:hypothetical protein